jgi:hypothetical protein
MKWIRILVLAAGALLALPLLMGVWLPDVITANEHTLAEERLASGHVFRVVQFWNRVDFYSTELRVTKPDGTTENHTLDGDDSKRWRATLTLDELNHTAEIKWGNGGRIVTSWLIGPSRSPLPRRRWRRTRSVARLPLLGGEGRGEGGFAPRSASLCRCRQVKEARPHPSPLPPGEGIALRSGSPPQASPTRTAPCPLARQP